MESILWLPIWLAAWMLGGLLGDCFLKRRRGKLWERYPKSGGMK
jgi:hypothetical protein